MRIEIGEHPLLLNEGEVSIREKLFWKIISDFYDSTPEKDWFYESEEFLYERWLGLKEIEISDQDFFEKYHCFKYVKIFQVLDREKFLWIKLKYGI